MDFIILIIGFFLLIKGADIFVDGASSIAKKIGIPSVIVGLTIVSLGTSAPELAVSLISSFNGNNGIAVGNVLGSNLFNTLVVLGGTAIVAPLLIKKSTIKRDYIATLVVTILTCGAGSLWGFIEGILILCGTTITTDADGVPLSDN